MYLRIKCVKKADKSLINTSSLLFYLWKTGDLYRTHPLYALYLRAIKGKTTSVTGSLKILSNIKGLELDQKYLKVNYSTSLLLISLRKAASEVASRAPNKFSDTDWGYITVIIIIRKFSRIFTTALGLVFILHCFIEI